MQTLARLFFALCLLGGFVLGSYGVLRESFADVATQADVLVLDKGQLDRTRLVGLRGWEASLVGIGVALELLPTDRQLTAEDRRWNAACAIAGFLLLAIYTLHEAFRTAGGP